MIEQRHLPEGSIPATRGDGAAPDDSLMPPFPEEFEHLAARNPDRSGDIGQDATSLNGGQDGDNDNYLGKPDHGSNVLRITYDRFRTFFGRRWSRSGLIGVSTPPMTRKENHPNEEGYTKAVQSDRD